MAVEPSERLRGVSALAEALAPFRSGAGPSVALPANATRSETVGEGAFSAAPHSVVGVSRHAPPPTRGRVVALGGMLAAIVAMAAITALAWKTHGAKQAFVIAPPDAGLSAPDPSGRTHASERASPDVAAPEDAGERAPPRAADAGRVTDAGRVAEARRKPPPPVEEPCKLTHYLDREGNMHFSTDCPPTTK
jgi:hypothetical protein